MYRRKELQKILLWRLSEERQSLKKLTDDQEENGERLFNSITDPFFGENADKCRAVAAILISRVYYLNLHSAINSSMFCGIDIQSNEGRNKIKEALSFLIGQTYDHLKANNVKANEIKTTS
jgi:hypothetical protein